MQLGKEFDVFQTLAKLRETRAKVKIEKPKSYYQQADSMTSYKMSCYQLVDSMTLKKKRISPELKN